MTGWIKSGTSLDSERGDGFARVEHRVDDKTDASFWTGKVWDNDGDPAGERKFKSRPDAEEWCDKQVAKLGLA